MLEFICHTAVTVQSDVDDIHTTTKISQKKIKGAQTIQKRNCATDFECYVIKWYGMVHS